MYLYKHKLFFLLPLIFLLNSCLNNQGISSEKSGANSFFINSNYETEIYFFDTENLMNNDGTRNITDVPNNENRMNQFAVSPSESYMIKAGEVEVLVDGGYQSFSYGNSETVFYKEIENHTKSKLLRKIATLISDDGVLDYLVVTHADFDHIGALAANGGIFDSFLNGEVVETLDGRNVKLNYIKHIIDFDNDIINHYNDTYEFNKFLTTKMYEKYIEKRDAVISKGAIISSKHIPAAYFFYDNSITIENKNIAMPTKIAEDDRARQNVVYAPGNFNKHYEINKEDFPGRLMFENERGFFEINIGKNTKLHFLYNWYYDHFRHHSVDSLDRNNISVILKVVNKELSFLTTGDGSGNVESSLLNYYSESSILENITVFKAAHHGSVRNGENSADLYNLISPKIVVLTGVAIARNEDNGLYNGKTTSYPRLTKKLFDNMRGTNRNPLIMETSISKQYRDSTNSTVIRYEPSPFYGDIFVGFKNNNYHCAHSYKDVVNGFVNDYVKNISFKTNNGEGNVLSLPETEWFKKIEKFSNFNIGE